MNKRGQFYITAAIIIVLALFSIANVVTYAIVKSEPKNIESLGANLREESPRIIDYGISNNKDIQILINQLIEDSGFQNYLNEKTENANISLIYGDKNNLYQTELYEENTGTIAAGGISTPIRKMNKKSKNIDVTPTGTVEVNLYGKNYSFNLKEDDLFYFLILQENQGERYIESGSSDKKQVE